MVRLQKQAEAEEYDQVTEEREPISRSSTAGGYTMMTEGYTR